MSGESWKEFSIQHKYAELPEEPRYIKKKKKKVHIKADHKHHYADIIFKPSKPSTLPYNYIGKYCTICGRIGDIELGGHLTNPDLPTVTLDNTSIWTAKYINLEDINHNG